MTQKARALDQWIRTDFRQINTELEELYFDNPGLTESSGQEIKKRLVDEGRDLIADLLNEGNTDEGFDSGFELLGDVGFYMAACRRHDITEPSREKKSPLAEASALAMQLGASLGVIPRFASCHLETHNRAVNGEYKTFTSLEDEKTFIDFNTRGVFSFIRASEALRNCLPLGVSHPITYDLLSAAKVALGEVYDSNARLFDQLDINRFFYCVRPYYRPHRVGLHEYRGANAGDFAGINVIDLLLGVCKADDPYYSQLLVDKFLFMRPDDQLVLRDCMRRKSLLDSFLDCQAEHKNDPWFQTNLRIFLEVCEAHGRVALQHHERLVHKFIERPAESGAHTDQADLTASGPPLPVLLKGLRKLCDMRCAAPDTEGFDTRYRDIQGLKDCLA
ncbi:PrnB family protein [Porticoccaceae bacterium nBUS_09]